MRVAPVITLTPEERCQLTRWSHGRSTPHRLVDRATIVLRAAEGKTNEEIVNDLRLNPRTVGLWRSRFALLRSAGIEKDAPRPGRTPRLSPQVIRTIIEKTLITKPKGETHWSTRTMAREVGVHSTTVHRIWKLHGIKPHLTQSFKLSRDQKFEEKMVDVVGLYMNPPEKSVVFSVDEKPQTQALERTQAILREVNALSAEEQLVELQRTAPELLIEKKKEQKRDLPELEGAEQGKVVTRIPPEPSKYAHIGHAYSFLVNYLYAKKYAGRCILKFEDTNPERCTQEYVDAMTEDITGYLRIDPDEVMLVSDDIPRMYRLAETLISKAEAYVCTCERERMQGLRLPWLGVAPSTVRYVGGVQHAI